MHCGPFANIAHGNNSLVADQIGLKLARLRRHRVGLRLRHGDGEVLRHRLPLRRAARRARSCSSRPCARSSTTAASTTTRASGARARCGARGRHGQRAPPPRRSSASSGCPPSSPSTAGPATPTRRSSSSSALRARGGRVRRRDQRRLRARRRRRGRARDAVVAACEQPSEFRLLYEDDAPIADKIEAVAKRVYGADGVYLLPRGGAADRAVHQRRPRRASRSAWPRRSCRCRPTRRCSARRRASRSSPRHPRLHGGRLARAALRRHHADARPRHEARRAERRHRREDGRTVGLF